MRNAAALVRAGTLQWLSGCAQPVLFVVDPTDADTRSELETWLARIPLAATVLPQRRAGLSGALNDALEAVRTPYVHWCGADDQAYWQRYAPVARALAAAAPPVWIVGRCDTRRADGRPTAAGVYRNLLHPTTRWLLPFTNVIGCPGVIFRADRALTVGGFDEGVVAAMDYDLWLRLYALEKPLMVDTPLGQFTVHGGSLTRAHRRASLEDCYRARRRYFRAAWIAGAARGVQVVQLKLQDLLGE